jgi:hypothetical protein
VEGKVERRSSLGYFWAAAPMLPLQAFSSISPPFPFNWAVTNPLYYRET